MSPRHLPPIDDIDEWYVDDLTFILTPDGDQPYTVDFTDWPGSVTIRKEAIAAVRSLCSPDTDGDGTRGRQEGTGWLTKSTQRTRVARVRSLLAWCETQGIESMSEFTAEHWEAFEAEKRETLNPYSFAQYVLGWRSFVAASPAPAKTFLSTRGRVPNATAPPSEDHYTVAQMKQIERAALRTVTNAVSRVQRTYRVIQESLIEEAPPAAQRQVIDLWHNNIPDRRPGGIAEAIARVVGPPEPRTGERSYLEHFFMLTPDEVTAAAALIAVRTGWNLSVLHSATAGALNAAVTESETVVTVATDKRRRKTRRHSVNVLVGSTAAGRAWSLVMDATEPTRHYLTQQGTPSDRLLLRASSKRPGGDKPHERVRAGVPDEPGTVATSWMPQGLTLDMAKVRRSVLTVTNPGPVHNTPETWRRNYLDGNEDYRWETQQRAAQGHERLRARAREEVEMVLLDEEDAPIEIANGSHDVATGACRDINRHPLTGAPCQESFLDCLKCSNAVALPRHLPRLVLLHQTLKDRSGATSEAAWERYAGHYLRLEAMLFDRARLTEATYRGHLQGATSQDRRDVAEVLEGKLDV
jgi:hypothetical protein